MTGLKWLLSALLCLGTGVARADDAGLDPLRTTLWQLHRYAREIDPYAGENRARWGQVLMRAGEIGATTAIDLHDDDQSSTVQTVVLAIGLIGLLAGGVGAIACFTGWHQQMHPPPEPRPNLAADEYMSAAGLDEFVRLDLEQQYAIASANPNLASFLNRVSAAYDLAVQYQLIAAPRPSDRQAR